MSTHIVPSISNHVSPSGINYGIELNLQRINEYGERSSGFVLGELTKADLEAIGSVISTYLRSNP